jgi:hypothetical protein
VLVRWLFGLTVLVFRGDPGEERRAADAPERARGAAPERRAGPVRTRRRLWFTALTRFIPRRRWAEVFPVTAATLLAWHRRPAARKYLWQQGT